jgi:hypothetical protein
MAPHILTHMRKASRLFIKMNPFIEILRVANRIILKRNLFVPTQDLPVPQELPK